MIFLHTLFFATSLHAFLFSPTLQFSPSNATAVAKQKSTVHRVKELIEISLLPKWLRKKASKHERLLTVVNDFKKQNSAHLCETGKRLARFIGTFGFHSLVEDKLWREIAQLPQEQREFFHKFGTDKKIGFTAFANVLLQYQYHKEAALKNAKTSSRIGGTVQAASTDAGKLAALLYYRQLYQALFTMLLPSRPPSPLNVAKNAEKLWLKSWLRVAIAGIRAEFNVTKAGMEDMLYTDKHTFKMAKNSEGLKLNEELSRKLADWSAKMQIG